MNRKFKLILIACAVISVPATLYSVTYSGPMESTSFSMSDRGQIGSANTFGFGVLVVGFNNSITSCAYSAAVGTGLYNLGGGNSLTIGTYNISKPDAVFVVGNGTGPGTDVNGGGDPSNRRRNSFEILKTGTVNIPGTTNLMGTTNLTGTANLTGTVNLGSPTAAVNIKGAPNFTSDSMTMGASNKYRTDMVTSGSIMNVNHYSDQQGVSFDLQVKDSVSNQPLTGVRLHAHESNSSSAIALYNLKNNTSFTNPGIFMHTYGLAPSTLRSIFEIRDTANPNPAANVQVRLGSNVPNSILPDLGVGISTPAAKLHVDGSALVTGGLTTGSVSTSGNASVSGKIIMGTAEISSGTSGFALNKSVSTTGNASVSGKIIMGTAEISSGTSGLTINKAVTLSAPIAAGDIPMYGTVP